MNAISIPTIGEILTEEFMEPFNLSTYQVAKAINVPASQIHDILCNHRQITADMSIRLGQLFGVDDRYFLNLQNDIDIRNNTDAKMTELLTRLTEAQEKQARRHGIFGWLKKK